MKKKLLTLVMAIVVVCVTMCGCGLSKEQTKKSETDEKEYYPYQKLNGEYVTLTDGTVLSEGPYCSTCGMYIMNQKTPSGKIIERYDHATDSVVYNNLENDVLLYVAEYDPVHSPYSQTNVDYTLIKSSKDILNQMKYVIGCYKGDEKEIDQMTITKEEAVQIPCGLDTTRWEGNMTFLNDEGEPSSRTVQFIAFGVLGSDGRPYLIASVLDSWRMDSGAENMPFFNEIADATVKTFGESPLPDGVALDDDSWSYEQFGVFEWKQSPSHAE